MTNYLKDLIIAAAALAVSAGAASAQALNADIPFAFEAAGKTLPAGRYKVDRIATDVYTLTNRSAGYSVFAPAASRHDPQKAWKLAGQPKLSFACSGERCALIELWNGGPVAYGFRRPKSLDMGVRIAEVTMRPDGKAD